jgi:hypothetical protein
MSYADDLVEKALVEYLRVEYDIETSKAWFGETESYTYTVGGCETCSWHETDLSFRIYYEDGTRWNSSIEKEGDPLNFFPVLFAYMKSVEDAEQAKMAAGYEMMRTTYND